MKKTIIIALCLLTAVTIRLKSQTTLATDLVSYWKLDETSGSVLDATNSYPGTVNGATTNVTGKINKSYSFDGTNDYISIPGATGLNIQGNTIALSAWVYPTANKHSVIVSKIHNSGTHVAPYFQYSLQFFYVATPTPRIYPRFCLSIGGTFRYVANTSLAVTLNQWHHLVGVYNGSTMKLYLDGSEVSSVAQTGNIDSYNTPVYISEIGSLDGSEVFQGQIDEIGIWKRELSSGEVSSLYNTGSGSAYPFGLPVYNYSANSSPAAGGTATMFPPGGQYPSGTKVTLTATTNSGYTFIGWNGSIMTNPYTVTISNHSGISAVFNTAGGYTFNTGVSPAGAGTITPGNGTTWSPGVNLTVTATANPGYTFSGWQAPHNGLPNPFQLTMNANQAVVANFSVIPVPPTVSTNTTVSSITKNSAVCGGNVTAAGTATVTARGICWGTAPNPIKSGSNFTVDGSGTGSYSSTISSLSTATMYYVRAYATSSAGTSYGDNVSFTTQSNDWQFSGNNTFFLDGNVGVGTQSPQTNLQLGNQVGVTGNPISYYLGITMQPTLLLKFYLTDQAA